MKNLRDDGLLGIRQDSYDDESFGLFVHQGKAINISGIFVKLNLANMSRT